MLRKVVEPELVMALDSWVPQEITDEILAYYLWRPELGQVRGITTYYPLGPPRCIFRINGRTQYFAIVVDGEIVQNELGRITSIMQGIRFTSPLEVNRENLRKFWNGGEF